MVVAGDGQTARQGRCQQRGECCPVRPQLVRVPHLFLLLVLIRGSASALHRVYAYGICNRYAIQGLRELFWAAHGWSESCDLVPERLVPTAVNCGQSKALGVI